MSGFAPIAIFAYRRTDTLVQVLDALETCPEFAQSPVFIFSDGPKSPAAAEDVKTVRSLVNSRLRANMSLIESPENSGLARSIIRGVTKLCEDYGRAIVIEDDLIVSPHILAWFNGALDRFADDARIMQVSGHMFGDSPVNGRNEGVLLPLTTSWGWATWKRAWDRFMPNPTGLEQLGTDRALRKRFDLGGVYPYARMMERQQRGEVDSWAIRWYWSVFSEGGLGLFPPQSLVLNIGDDNLATHGRLFGNARKAFRLKGALAKVAPALPDRIEVDPAAWRKVRFNIVRSRI